MPYEVNLKNIFVDFNPSKFLVYSCLFVFSLFLALRFDKTIECSYFLIFFPLWFWKLVVIFGCLVGCCVWIANPQFRRDRESSNQFKSMIVSTGLQIILLIFEILVCDKLEFKRPQMIWSFVFIPLYSLSVVSTGLTICALKNSRSFEFELFNSVNILQFLFISLRLDSFISWRWVIIFVPVWISLCIGLIGLFYVSILSILLVRSREISGELKRKSVISSLAYASILIPFLIFIILLTNKLDKIDDLPWAVVVIPLLFTLFSCIFLSFMSRPSNYWWFGIKKDFCLFFLEICPLLQKYANISYTFSAPVEQIDTPNTDNNNNNNQSTVIKNSSIKKISQFVDDDIYKLNFVTLDVPD